MKKALIPKPYELAEHAPFQGIAVPNASARAVQTILRIFEGFLDLFPQTIISQGLEAVSCFIGDERKVAVISSGLCIRIFVYGDFELSASAKAAYLEILVRLPLSGFTKIIPQAHLDVIF